jgi:HSP20 family protein
MDTGLGNDYEFRSDESEKRGETQYLEIGPFRWRLNMRAPAWRPPTDLYETERNIVVRVEVAGMREEDFGIELNGRVLTIRGLRQDAVERRAYHQMEIHFGEFIIDLELPHFVQAEQVEAVYVNGFLLVSLPKAQPHQITIAD